MNEPTNAMTRNEGTGAMEVRWDAPSIGVVDYYDVYISTESTGTFEKANLKPIEGTYCKIPNLEFGATVFCKVRGVDADGVEGPLSALAVDADCLPIGDPEPVEITLRVTGPVGDVIPKNAIFAAVCNEQVVAFRVLDEHTL